MNREIKFRAWDSESGKMFTPDGIYLADGDCRAWLQTTEKHIQVYPSKEFPVMQFTGLKDKNGKEIYEGDMLKMYRHDDITHKHEVGTVFRNGERVPDIREVKFQTGTFYTQNGFDIKVAFMHMARPGESSEIIGNIYENPDLLK